MNQQQQQQRKLSAFPWLTFSSRPCHRRKLSPINQKRNPPRFSEHMTLQANNLQQRNPPPPPPTTPQQILSCASGPLTPRHASGPSQWKCIPSSNNIPSVSTIRIDTKVMPQQPQEKHSTTVSHKSYDICTCVVCDESFPFFSCHAHVEPKTSHPMSCKSCWEGFIREEINNRRVDANGTIRCFDNTCQARLTQDNLQQLISKEMFIEYCDFMTLRTIQNTRDARNCFRECVNASCKAVAEYSNGVDNPCIRCYKCKTLACFNCKCAFHKGLSCQEYQQSQQRLDAASLKVVQESTRECPKCKERQWKPKEECDIATCRSCGYRFCYSCLADIRVIIANDNSHHRPTCPHFRSAK